ncbi:phenylpyruvate tautomerase MIF-related protein [Thermoanaerobacterium sp. RBIITD]|uniref:phenylpyruvate tautomerase MIF-related protein n=1 Tax=Thermoanaerobacterium sp. RBIITD TaxID=1550240 RepID=UPI000BB84649|nr:phenylpyruvate tautomerase MIF-related protein [Thermoanaerobacterium sp. RBIITD]SNX55039.1 Phenylpyruvate tautomerase PptA, 4-oxalocrotonate tautomerase family [Thermoanaerobacterium sp. RBIITD]
MPIINSITKEKLSDNMRETLKKEFASMMQDVAGKSESWLMVRFTEGDDIYFHGEPLDKGAIVEIQLIGRLSKDQKERLSASICDILNKNLNYPKNSIYIVIQEFSGENWGYNGSTF